MTHHDTDQPLPPLVSVIGPTASGKTQLAVALARHFQGEIISADSRQVYRGMDIGTGKDLHEYGTIPFHLIDIVNPGYEYNLYEFCRDVCSSIASIRHRAALPILAGGTGLYLDAVLSRYQLTTAPSQDKRREELEQLSDKALVRLLYSVKPAQHNTTDLLDRKRLIRAIEIAQSEQDDAPVLTWPPFRAINLGIRIEREQCRARITDRLKRRLKEGMIEEVEALHRQGLSWDQLDFYGLEYRFIAQYLQNRLSYNDMFQKLNTAIHQFAKQQYKWFRKLESKGHHIHWLDAEGNLAEQGYEVLQRALQPTHAPK